MTDMAEGASASSGGVPEQQAQTATETATQQAEPQTQATNVGAPTGQGERASQSPSTGAPTPQTETAEKPAVNLLDDDPPEEDDKASTTLGAPEGDYEVKAPDGSIVNETSDAYKAFAGVAKELNLSNEAVQKVMDAVAPSFAGMVEKNRAEWGAAAAQDEEYGGANFKQNLKAVNKAYNQTTTPEFRELMKATGLSNHPEVIRHFYRLSKTMSDGSFITSGTRDADERGQQFYKGMNP